MGKTSNHRQSSDGRIGLLNYHFFAEIFVRDGGSVHDASLTFPDGKVEAFEDLGFVQEVHGGRYDAESELDASYPNGDYLFRFATGSGNVDGRVLSVRGTGQGDSRIPASPLISLRQDGAEVGPLDVRADRDLTVSWSDFASGAPDPNGIVDDLVFVVLGDCRGVKTVHSGRPFEGTEFLTYGDRRFSIPAERLTPGEPHQLFVEHARVDTSTEDDVVGLVTYAATTFLDIEVSGEAKGAACPSPMPKMDGGQTDRPER